MLSNISQLSLSCIKDKLTKKLCRNLIKELKQNKIHCYFDDAISINDAYFDYEDRRIGICKTKDGELLTLLLLHEYGHAIDYLYDPEVYSNRLDHKLLLDLWIAGRMQLSLWKKDKIISNIARLEQNADKIVVSILEDNDCIIDKLRYIQVANACLLDYMYAYYYRKYPIRGPTKLQVYEFIPTTFIYNRKKAWKNFSYLWMK